jgi:5-methylcytosine-specific restriction endonuclease McrA
MKRTNLSAVEKEKLLADLHRDIAARNSGYRERALKLFPHLCARCARTFEGKRLKELTVHHRDHNHDNNPPDGSNWELLCIYCHDHEHSKSSIAGYFDASSIEAEKKAASRIANPFAGLDSLLKPKP